MDDLDRLLERLEPIEPPPGFARGVAAAARASRPARPRGLWLALDALAIALLALASSWLGVELHESGALDLLELILLEAPPMRESLGALLEALLEALPWWPLGLVGLNLAAVVALSQRALGPGEPAGAGA